jgi:hypothetical protein
MEKMDYRETMKEIIKSYDKKPKGWQALIRRNPRGIYDILFSNPEEVWLIKVDTIFKPNPIGFGIKLESPPEIPYVNAPPYGFRPVRMRSLKEMLRNGMPFEMVMDRIIKETMRISPVPSTRIRTPITTIGPYIHHQSGLDILSGKHRELSVKLDKELLRLLRREYPFYG